MIRCSALPRVINCPASKTAPEIVIDKSTPEAQDGSATHSLLAYGLLNPAVTGEAFTNYMKMVFEEFPAADAEEVRRMYWNGVHLLDKFGEGLKMLGVENEMLGEVLTGHSDYVAIIVDRRILIVIDWKTGRVERDYTAQGKGYILLAIEEFFGGDFTKIEGAKFITGWLRWRDKYDVYPQNRECYTVEELQEFAVTVGKAYEADYYNPGEWCEFCPLGHECKARTALVRQAVSAFGEDLPATPEALGRAYPMYKIAKSALDKYYRLLKEALQAGSIKLPDGKTLLLKPDSSKKVLFGPSLVAHVAEISGMPHEDALAALSVCTTVAKGKLEKLVKAASPPRQGAANIRELYEDLEAEGQVVYKETMKVTVEK